MSSQPPMGLQDTHTPRRDRRAWPGVEPVATSRLMDYPYSHIKGNSVRPLALLTTLKDPSFCLFITLRDVVYIISSDGSFEVYDTELQVPGLYWGRDTPCIR